MTVTVFYKDELNKSEDFNDAEASFRLKMSSSKETNYCAVRHNSFTSNGNP